MAYDQIGVNLGNLLMQWGLQRMQRKEDEKLHQRDRAEKLEDFNLQSRAQMERAQAIAEAQGARERARYDHNLAIEGVRDTNEDERAAADRENRIAVAAERNKRRVGSASGPAPPKPAWTTVRDPKDPTKWRRIDQNSGRYATDAEGNALEVAPPTSAAGAKGRREKAEDQLYGLIDRFTGGGKAKPVMTGAAGGAPASTTKPVMATGGSGKPTSAPAANKAPYPDGTRLKGPDGKVYIVRNGEPVLEQ